MQSGTIYVGSSQDVEERWKRHRKELVGGYHFNRHLQSAWNRYGEEAFNFGILEETEASQVLRREQFWLDEYLGGSVRLYNIARDATAPMRGRRHSLETRKKIKDILAGIDLSAANMGKRMSEETKKKMSLSHLGLNAKPYPAFRNVDSGEIIEAGENLTKLCKERGLSQAGMCDVIHGRQRRHRDWVLADDPRSAAECLASGTSGNYPALKNVWTGERIANGWNLRKLCRQRGLAEGQIRRVVNGQEESYRGWVVEGKYKRGEKVPLCSYEYPLFANVDTGETFGPGFDLKAASRERGLDHNAMYALRNGKRSSYKGWQLGEGGNWVCVS